MASTVRWLAPLSEHYAQQRRPVSTADATSQLTIKPIFHPFYYWHSIECHGDNVKSTAVCRNSNPKQSRLSCQSGVIWPKSIVSI